MYTNFTQDGCFNTTMETISSPFIFISCAMIKYYHDVWSCIQKHDPWNAYALYAGEISRLPTDAQRARGVYACAVNRYTIANNNYVVDTKVFTRPYLVYTTTVSYISLPKISNLLFIV